MKKSELISEKSELILQIKLIKIIKSRKEISDMTYNEKLTKVQKLKEEGVLRFKAVI